VGNTSDPDWGILVTLDTYNQFVTIRHWKTIINDNEMVCFCQNCNRGCEVVKRFHDGYCTVWLNAIMKSWFLISFVYNLTFKFVLIEVGAEKRLNSDGCIFLMMFRNRF
jgi:hypothetical protein